MKGLLTSLLFLLFMQACSQEEQDAIVDRQVERSTEKVLEAIKEDTAEAVAASEASEPVKKKADPDAWVTFDPMKEMTEKMEAAAKKHEAEAAAAKSE